MAWEAQNRRRKRKKRTMPETLVLGSRSPSEPFSVLVSGALLIRK